MVDKFLNFSGHCSMLVIFFPMLDYTSVDIFVNTFLSVDTWLVFSKL